MAKLGLEKRLDDLERLANVRKTDRLKVYFCDGTVEEMGVLSLLCKAAWDQAHSVAWYEVLGGVKSRKLLKIIDALLQ